MNHPPLEQFEAWVEGSLPPEACERFEAHLASCGPCAAVLQREARVSLALQQVARLPMRLPRPLAALGAMAALLLVVLGAGGGARPPQPVPEPRRQTIEAARRAPSRQPQLAGLGLPPRYEQPPRLEQL